MKTFNYPFSPNEWDSLLLRRRIEKTDLSLQIQQVFKEVKEKGDQALLKFTNMWDGVDLDRIIYTSVDWESSLQSISKDLADAIQQAIHNITTFHKAQIENFSSIEVQTGVSCWRKSIGIEKVGLYIPGGTAPLFSTVLMLVIPAQIAGCKEIVICTPPNAQGCLDPVIAFTLNALGIKNVFLCGGAQAIAAMTFGTESIPSVYKIFGPGNQYVTEAKALAQAYGVAMDMPAGPSEVAIWANENANPAFVASDLLSQAEHGTDSEVLLLSDSLVLIDAVKKEIELQIAQLPRKKIAKAALENSKCAWVPTLEEGLTLINAYAPEHLIIQDERADAIAEKILNAGSVFIGPYSTESLGDYASGTNHTLPTYGWARSYSGVSTDSFVRKITFQKINEEGILQLGPMVEKMAAAEGLEAHKNAVSIRLKYLRSGL